MGSFELDAVTEGGTEGLTSLSSQEDMDGCRELPRDLASLFEVNRLSPWETPLLVVTSWRVGLFVSTLPSD